MESSGAKQIELARVCVLDQLDLCLYHGEVVHEPKKDMLVYPGAKNHYTTSAQAFCYPTAVVRMYVYCGAGLYRHGVSTFFR